MKILSAVDVEGKELDHQTIQTDYENLCRQHLDALKNIPMWDMFGGTITIGKHQYQVA